MIIPDFLLRAWAEGGGLTPFDPACVNPASVDLRFSGRAKLARVSGWQDFGEHADLVIYPGELYLLDTLEFVTMPEMWAGSLMLKSSIGRMGLEHLHAGYFDPSFSGTATLEIKNLAPWPVVLKKGQRIVQLVMTLLYAKSDKSYAETGRYNGQCGPTEAR